MRLFIAEKPSVAKAIAGELGATGKGDGFIECGTDKVTWCFGHMLEQADPDEYTPDDVPRGQSGKKVWRVDELPIIPQTFAIRIGETAVGMIKQRFSLFRLVYDVDFSSAPAGSLDPRLGVAGVVLLLAIEGRQDQK